MRRLTAIAAAIILTLAIAGPAVAANTAGRGFMPPNARVHGHTLTDFAAAYVIWALGSPAATNPLVGNRCERSTLDPKVWFLPVSLGGDYGSDCHVPLGAFLLVAPGFYECSAAEGNGSTAAALQACANTGFAALSLVQLSLDGRTATHLDRYVVTTPLGTLPGPNLIGPDPTPTMTKGYFLLLHPLSRGSHTARAYDEFATFDFTAGITFHITVD